MNYSQLTTQELEDLKLKASTWLKENSDHPSYNKGLFRYRQIFMELQNRRKPIKQYQIKDNAFVDEVKSHLI